MVIEWRRDTLDHKHATLSVGLVKILEAYAGSLGVDFRIAAGACDVDPGILGDGEARMPALQFASLWLKIAEMGDDPFPGLNYGIQAAAHYPAGSILFSLMRNCPTVGQALEVFVRYHRIMADDIRPLCQKEAGLTRLSWDTSALDIPVPPHVSEALLCTCYALFSNLTQGKIRPEEVCFTHPGPDRPEAETAYQDAFDAPVHFSRDQNELIFNTRDLDIKIDLADASLYQVLETHADRILAGMPSGNPLSARVSRLILDGIFSGGVPDMDAVAGTLAMGRRSLQTKLKKEGTGFRTLLQAARKQVALDFLSRQDLSVCELAFMLGYSDQSAFNHAFRRWTGRSPKAVQNRQKQ